ncbi:MAG: biotin/lipoate A/B protein ligase family protein [Candidatus Moranbacteria bacterium]|nr:biotin/lipoate A/B protein ligase family protein [Candidatus Moranbacteria bacterium]
MKHWRLLDLSQDAGAKQMAIDEAILRARIKNQVPNTLRFYTWAPPAITVGFFQDIEEEVDIEKVKKQGVDIVRRYTGGGAVFHNKEITYSLALTEKETSRDVVKSYEKICAGLIEGLKMLGLKASFSPINDILANGKKISGNAQTRKEGVILQHGTILLDVEVEKMFSLLKVPDEKIKDKLIKNVKERVTSLKRETNGNLSAEEIKQALTKGFEKVFGISFIQSGLIAEEIKTADRLYKEKYLSDAWNYQRKI